MTKSSAPSSAARGLLDFLLDFLDEDELFEPLNFLAGGLELGFLLLMRAASLSLVGQKLCAIVQRRTLFPKRAVLRPLIRLASVKI